MSKNPFLNALGAAFYIVLIGSFLYYGTRVLGRIEESVIIPITMISLFTLSAAMMGFIFFYRPVQMYLDGQKKEGASLFLRSLGIFAIITILFVFTLFSRALF